MSDQQHHDHGSFLSGFTVGMLAGAVGYFLFGTKKGKNITKNLASEWQQAKSQLTSDGALEIKDGEDLKKMLAKGLATIGQVIGAASKPTPKTKPKPKASRVKKKTSTRKFKGT